MSKPRPNHGDPERRRARLAARRAAVKRGVQHLPRQGHGLGGQADHASNPRGTRERRDGEAWLARQPEPEVVNDFPESY